MSNEQYNSILEQFFHTEKITEYSLDKIRLACDYFGNPQESFRCIHIAGTNGKGSVSKMIFQMLKDSGRKVGVYTSPHNIDIRERFETEGGLISEDDFARIAETVIDYGQELSYYEKCVVLAFLYFRDQKCEYAVIEVGMGGRLDATNIITPILSVITSISYDHMEFLGDTIEGIASEKGGIIKPGVPVILYGHNSTLERIADIQYARVIFPEERDIRTNLLGEHQVSNGRIAYEAGVWLGIPDNIIQDSLLHVDHHGRLEYVLPNLLIDGAHNEDGMKRLSQYLETSSQDWDDVIFCCNLKKGKTATLITERFPSIGSFVIIDSSHQMVEDAHILAVQFEYRGKSCRILSPIEIIMQARENPQRLFVVFGSLYMVGEFFSGLSPSFTIITPTLSPH